MTNARLVVGSILIAAGMGALLGINIWNYFWPAALIFLGLRLINNQQDNNWSSKDIAETGENKIDETVIFNSINKKYDSSSFDGGRVTMIFGGGEVDLRGAKIDKEKTVNMEVEAIFGGIKIVVPKNWIVTSSVTGIFGGFDNKTRMTKDKESGGQLNIRGTAIFGGGEVVN